MLRLRATPLQAARDMFYTNALLEVEADVQKGRNLFLELFRVPRNRRATQASSLVMFMQQFCGVNVIAYYSTTIFLQAGFSRTTALLVTMGTGLVNWIFAAPALYTSTPSLRKHRGLFLNVHLSRYIWKAQPFVDHLPSFGCMPSSNRFWLLGSRGSDENWNRGHWYLRKPREARF